MAIHISADLFPELRADTIAWMGIDPWSVPGDWVDATEGDIIPLDVPIGRDVATRALYKSLTGSVWAEASAPRWYLAYLVGGVWAWSLQGHVFGIHEGTPGQPFTAVPSLGGLDPFDGTTLPGGGRVVDADALRLSLLEVAG